MDYDFPITPPSLSRSEAQTATFGKLYGGDLELDFKEACRYLGAMEGHEMAWATNFFKDMQKRRTGDSRDKEY